MARVFERERAESATRLAEVMAGAAARELVAREEGRQAAESTTASLLAAARDDQQRAEAEAERLRSDRDLELQARLTEQREALEKDKTDAVNAARSEAFNDKLKLEGKLEEVQRQLQNKTAGDLGEGAEVDLFEMLRTEFPDDRIRRVPKGSSGADIIHEVLHHGKICGSIIYDSKNCSAWRQDYAKKLRQDQLAAKAEHAVLALATAAFPAGARQLHVVDGVILTNPARASVVAQILRKQLVQVHSLRLSSEAQDEKTTELYAFITSDRCTQLLERMSAAAGALEDIEVKEVKAHEATWKKRGEIIRSVQKHQADFTLEIERIIGTAEGERAR
jgi:hypothetical protein